MKQMVVAVFDNETAALEGLSELRNLHSEAGVSLYASAVIVKDKAGKISVKQLRGSRAGRSCARNGGRWVGRWPRRARGRGNA